MPYIYTAFDALGDPTRRRVLELLRDGPLSVGEVATRLPVSRPAVSQHLAALRRAGLVTYAVEGRRHVYGVDRAALAETRAWFDGFWDALDRYPSAPPATAGPPAPAEQGAPVQAHADTDPAPVKKSKKRGKRKKKGRKDRS